MVLARLAWENVRILISSTDENLMRTHISGQKVNRTSPRPRNYSGRGISLSNTERPQGQRSCCRCSKDDQEQLSRHSIT